VGLDGVCMYSKTIVDIFWGTRVRKVGIVRLDEAGGRRLGVEAWLVGLGR